MIRYISNENVDRNLWDAGVERAFNSSVCATSWYLDKVAPGWGAVVEDDYSRLFPVPFRTRFGIQYVFQPDFIQQLGLFSQDDGLVDITPFLKAVPDSIRYIDYNIRYNNCVSLTGVKQKKNLNLVLDIDRTYEIISANYNENLKRNIRKAGKNKLEINKKGDVREIIELFRDNRGKMIKTFNSMKYDLLDDIIRTAPKGIPEVWVVEDSSGTPCAGAVFMIHSGGALFLFSGLSKDGREKGAMHFLIDCFIKSYCGDLRYLDFEGSNDQNLAKFYGSFGADESVYLHITYNLLPYPLRWLKQ